ncbi:hypothetical protein [Sphingomonas sp. Leaf4]|uniref:hypothetical protein n=1 Tax=Sphingomonas sp. Leaf4 TaxID=2876553 RepID=UPI001E3918B5|nr:hypothetical protein [Sphingomonas sp. Leaf4]
MMMVIISMLAFGAGAAVAGFVLIGTDWRRVFTIASGRPDPHRVARGTDQRWRRVHIEADARAPFARTSRPR